MPAEEDLSLEHMQLLLQAEDLLEKRAGVKVQEGSNPSLRTLRLTIDPFEVTHRPLVWYIYVKVVNTYILWKYGWKHGLRRRRFGNLE